MAEVGSNGRSTMETEMTTRILTLATSAFLLAAGAIAANAQQGLGDPMMRQGQPDTVQQRQQMMQQDERTGQQRFQRDEDDDRRYGGPGTGWGYGPGAMGGGMMVPGMMGGGMTRMMLIMLDADGGALSQKEFQAVHERMFRAMDANDDDRLTPEEMQGFMQGMDMPAQQQ